MYFYRVNQKACIAVFCGSARGVHAAYAEAAASLGAAMARNGVELVYGGGHIGLMGVLADSVLVAGGHITGVITDLLKDKELAHPGAQEMRVVNTMDERKKLMVDLADAFIIMPGGFGTLDEMFEVLSLNQLGITSKPVGLLNVRNFFGPLLSQLDRCTEEGFLRPEHRNSLVVDENPEALLNKMLDTPSRNLGGWLEEFKRG